IPTATGLPPQYRPLPQLARTYDNWDMPLMIDANSPVPGQPGSLYPNMNPEVFRSLQQSNDAWLSPRFPEIWAPQALANGPYPVNGYSGTGTFAPIWPAIGAPLEFPNGVAPQGGRLYDTPAVLNGTGTVQVNQPLTYNNRVTDRSYVDASAAATAGAYPLIPGSVTVT